MWGTGEDTQKGDVLPKGVLTWLGLFMGALSVLSLFQYGFKYGLGPTLTKMLVYYDRLISVPAGWFEPVINAGLIFLHSITDWQLVLHLHWKHVFVLVGIYFFRMAAHSFRIGLTGTGTFRALWGFFVALLISALAGTIDATQTDLQAAFLMAAIPVAGVFIFELGFNLWNSTILRTRTAKLRGQSELNWWHEFRRCSALDFLRNSLALVFLGIGLQIPIVQDLSSPGLAMLGGLIIALSFYWLWSGTRIANSIRNEGEYWRMAYWRTGNPRIGAAMLGVFVLMGVFLLLNAGLGLIGL